jgi:hypothetical protein
MTAPRISEPEIRLTRHFYFNGSILVNKNSFMYLDTDDVKPASSQADTTVKARNQRGFARRFVGLTADTRLAASTQVVPHFPVMTDVEGEFDCASATFEVDDLVGAAEDSGGTALENMKLEKVTDPDLAIGYVTEREANSTTRVKARLISRVGGEHSFAPRKAGPVGAISSSTAAMGANLTLTVNDARLQCLHPDQARDLILPAEADSFGDSFWVQNDADDASTITVKNDAGGTILTVPQNYAAILFCDGTAWRGGRFLTT